MIPYTCDPKFSKDKLQRAIINLDHGRHIVLAPPGCGKTDILAERVIRALSLGVKEDQMLCLTFTNRAARGMYKRIAERLKIQSPELFVGNVHKFCAHFLFQEDVIPKKTVIIDENETQLLIQSLLGLDEKPLTDKTDKNVRNIVNGLINLQHLTYAICCGLPINLINIKENDDNWNLVYRCISYFNILQNPLAFITYYQNLPPLSLSEPSISQCCTNPEYCLQLIREYQKYKTDNNLIDFEDLLILTYAYAYQNQGKIKRYSWIQIDEIQDLNPLQIAIIDLFTEPDNITLYLGDEQQAIFSFIGAKLSTLEWIKQRCGQNIHHLENNYRSPQYLLDIFNTYAQNELKVQPQQLPKTDKRFKQKEDSLQFIKSVDRDREILAIVDQVKYFCQKYPNEHVAVLAAWNKDVTEISEALDQAQIRHFRICANDVFSLPETQLLFAHLHCLYSHNNIMSWSKVLYGLNIYHKPSLARKFVIRLKDHCLMPSDLVEYNNSSYLLECEQACKQTFVIFDTETTGLDLQYNDIVQIAAVKVNNGQIIDRFSILLQTDQTIAPTLDSQINPLVQVYANGQKVARKDGLQRFLDFVKDYPVFGHNVNYDRHILESNLRREGLTVPKLNYFDTLKICQLLYPSLQSYKLKNLIEQFDLQGQNSHLADDDVFATFELLKYLLTYFKVNIKESHIDCLKNSSAEAQMLQQYYGAVFREAKEHLFLNASQSQVGPDTALVAELKHFYNFLLNSQSTFKKVPRLEYVFDFLNQDVLKIERSLYEQLQDHLIDIMTYRETDLCESSVIKENIFVSTVHKAKGLEFENVIVFEVTNEVYPSYWAKIAQDAESKCQESARLLYVAITRAKKRLTFTMSQTKSGFSKKGYPYTFPIDQSRFIWSILPHFTLKYY